MIILITSQKSKAAFLNHLNNVSSEDKENVKTARIMRDEINNNRLNKRHENLNDTVKTVIMRSRIDNSRSDERHVNLSDTVKTEAMRDRINNNKLNKKHHENLNNTVKTKIMRNEIDNNKLASYVRNHWSIESEYHWELDVHLQDDADKKHNKIAAETCCG